jgi:penicillin-binding protein 1A
MRSNQGDDGVLVAVPPVDPRIAWWDAVLFTLIAGASFQLWWAEHWPPVRDRIEREADAAADWIADHWPAARDTTVRFTRTGASAAVAGSRVLGRGAGRGALWSWHHRPHPKLRPSQWGKLATTLVLIGIGVAVLVVTMVVAIIAAPIEIHAFAVTTEHSPVVLPPLAERSVVYASDGSVMAVLHAENNRRPVKFSDVAPVAVQAVLDTEDSNYWKHGAVDGRALLRAFMANISAGGTRQGGSTITQQLVKNTLLTPKRTVGRKIKEMVLADRVQQQLGKKAVLERYLNTVYFGQGAYGIEAAAETYFNIPASKLQLDQAALLAGLIQSPDGYDPLRNPQAAAARRREVLDLMVEHHHLDRPAANAAAAVALPTSVNKQPEGKDYFTDAVKQELLADKRLGATFEDRYRALFSGGLQIHTTLDPKMQHEAEAAVAQGLPKANQPLSAALATVDPTTGAVRAVVGGTDFGSSQYNAALGGQGRQPGSSFKVFTLVAALQNGHSPNEMVDGSSPCTIPNPGGKPNPWRPENFEGEAFGRTTLTDATAHSINCAYARLALAVGLQKVADVAHQMGITNHLDVVPSMTLGTNVVTPLQMASAYATLAADGVYHPPHLVQEVDGQDGKSIIKHDDGGKRVLDPQIARQVTQVLQQVVLAGTGRAAAVPGHTVVGKTGTAENYQDAWFVGYTPDLATAVWMGDPNGEVPMRNVQGINVVGGSFPAKMWSAFMSQALADLPSTPFIDPAPSSGVTPGGASPNITTWCSASCGKTSPSSTPDSTSPKHHHH